MAIEKAGGWRKRDSHNHTSQREERSTVKMKFTLSRWPTGVSPPNGCVHVASKNSVGSLGWKRHSTHPLFFPLRTLHISRPTEEGNSHVLFEQMATPKCVAKMTPCYGNRHAHTHPFQVTRADYLKLIKILDESVQKKTTTVPWPMYR